ncbi:MAG: glycosyltransferase [Thermodesulfobacteriota bacterium]
MNHLPQTRVLILSDAIAHRNGVGSYYCDLVDQLRARLPGVDLICPTLAGENPFQGRAFPLPGDPTQKIYLPRLRPLLRLIKQTRPQAVVAPIPGPFGLAGLLIARWQRIPFIAGFHTRYDDLIELSLGKGLGKRLRIGAGYWQKLFFRSAAAVVANSREMASTARSEGAARVDLVGTPLHRCFLNSPVKPAVGKLSTVVFAGRLAPEKNIAHFTDAAAQLNHLRFVVAGDGPMKPLVQRRAEALANLEYAGWCDREKLMKIMDKSDLLVLPSKVEGFGTIALEAMARRINVLVSPACGLLGWPLLAGSVFVQGTEESLAEAIHRIARMGKDTRIRSARRACLASRRFSQATVDHWAALIHGMTMRRPAEETSNPAWRTQTVFS